MNRILLIITLLLTALAPMAAQNRCRDRQAMRREVEEFKLKFMAQEMDLKEDQQKKFFEVYRQMSDEKEKLFKETKALEKKLADSENATEAEYENVSKAITAAKEKDAEIEKRYDEKFSQFLTSRQIFQMKSAEHKFREKMHEMRQKRRSEKRR